MGRNLRMRKLFAAYSAAIIGRIPPAEFAAKHRKPNPATRIREYEAREYMLPDLPPHVLLRELMVQHDLRQGDLPEVGPQSVVSEVLAGKRSLNLRQVKALADRFGVPMEIFVA